MDNLISSSANALATVFALVLMVYYLSRNKSKKKAAPEASGGWPLIGHLHLLGGPKPPHMVLADMSDKTGPIFTIRMGVRPTLVVSNWEIAKECFTTNDKAFASRPKTLATQLMGYNRTMFGFSPYGSYWRHMRKIAMLELLSNHRLEMLRHVRESVVKTSSKELYKLWQRNKNSSNKVLVELKRWFGDITLNVIFGIIVGKSVGYMTTDVGDESETWKEALREFFVLSGRFVPADAIPLLRYFDIGGYQRAMIKTSKELDLVVKGWLKEHKEKRASGIKQGEEDFMDLMLNILDSTEVAQGPDSDTINKATCLGLILAGSDTTTVTLTWALSLLVNNPEALKKAQNELDIHVGKERQVQESDVKNLVYLQAILKETMRL